MADIVILGVFVADAAYRAGRLPRMGETILGSGFALGPGGKGSNQAVACGRAGARVAMLARIGRDTFGDMAEETWRAAGVAFAGDRVDEPTGSAMIFVDEASGDNAIVIVPGAAAGIGPADVEARRDLIGGAKVFVTQLEQPVGAATAGLRIAREAGVVTLLNPAPAMPLPDEVLAMCDYVTPNETEAEALTGIAVADEDGARRAADALLAKGVAEAVILTLGARGALFHARGVSEVVPARPAGPVVETTGAGDAFNAGFATALAEGRAPFDAVRFGNALAGLSITRPGAAASMPTRAEIDAHLAGRA
ncbi:6-phosphofructokinase [Hasllibacter halocynthiae]|uniref:Ribokinase n=1 Tax=Hasllibacter halocynthiae TaxID=595589 RepID=A0A2T0X7Q4_9RHOB|nr:ribokinase [Hasllibacter halocynthiae]PRY94969.1 6-phosphofructokinase [Hasllibacter halocynthiae]